MNNNYVVYLHERLDRLGHIFYCGSGLSIRPYSKSGRNKYWKSIVDKYGYRIHIIAFNLTKEESLCTEGFITREHQDIGMCEACLDIPIDSTYFERTEETKNKIREALIGKKHTEETKNKISKNMVESGVSKGENNPMFGRNRSGEAGPMYGKTHSEETKKKQSEIKIGRNNPMYGRTGSNSPHLGKKASEETRNKMRESHLGKPPTTKGGMWYTNDLINKIIQPNESVPEGFHKGRIRINKD